MPSSVQCVVLLSPAYSNTLTIVEHFCHSTQFVRACVRACANDSYVNKLWETEIIVTAFNSRGKRLISLFSIVIFFNNQGSVQMFVDMINVASRQMLLDPRLFYYRFKGLSVPITHLACLTPTLKNSFRPDMLVVAVNVCLSVVSMGKTFFFRK